MQMGTKKYVITHFQSYIYIVNTFSRQKFPKNNPLPFNPYDTDEKNQTLKLVLATAVVDLVLYLNLELGSALVSSLS